MIYNFSFSKIFLNWVLFFSLLLFPSLSFSQALTEQILSEEFLAGLPPSIRDEIEVKNSVSEDIELENLFQSDSSVEKNKVILQKIKEQLEAVEQRFSGDEAETFDKLKIFGEDFFNTLQSSFMPVNVPNIGSDYIVDVGDSFTLLTTGKITNEYELIVQRDGSLVVPDFGKVIVAGQTLRDSEKLLEQLISSTSVGISSHLVLSKIRDVQILLLGGVENPGIYTMSGGSTILGALNIAGGIAKNGSYRNIELRRDGEIIEDIDLYDIFVFGKYDPRSSLRSGDTIFVHPTSFYVPVSGGVNNSAIFEALPGETAQDLISFASGFSSSFSGFNSVLLSRSNLENKTYNQINVDTLNTVSLKPRDSIMVPSYESLFDPAKKVLIEGSVRRPGTYYINEGDTLSTLIRRAGGYKEDAYIYGGALFREDALNKEKIYAQLNYSDTVNYIVSNIGKSNRSVTPAALDLLVEELRSVNYSGRVIGEFNLQKLNSDMSLDMVLRDQDRIVIPSLQKVVYLFGDFRNASNLTYNPSLSIKEYVELVGGVKKSADNSLIVIDPDGMTHIYNHNDFFSTQSIEIYPGSIIYAPRDVGKLSGILYASTVSPILSSLALTLASLNSISD